jgi:PAS domain S-box-containing protein
MDKKAVQIAQHKEKSDLDGMLMSIGKAFISLDQEWKCIYVNDWTPEILHKSKLELMGKIIWEVFPEMKQYINKKNYTNSMTKRTSMSFEINYSIYNKWLNVNIIPHDNGIDIFFDDITESKLIDIAKEHAEERFVKAFGSCPIPLSISRLSDERIVDVNESFLELFEFKRKEVLGNTHNLLKIYGNLSENNDVLIKGIRRRNALNKHELVLYTKTGKLLNLIFSTELIQIDGEHHVLSTFIDITEKLKSQKIIAESEVWFRSIADNSPVMIWGSDNNQSCNYVNSTWIDFTGCSVQVMEEGDWGNVVHPDDLENFHKIYNNAFDSKKSFNREYRLKRLDGKYRWIFEFAKPIIMPDGSFKGYIGSCADVHSRRTLYSKLERLVKERTLELMSSLEKEKSLNEAKSRFVSMASHEFRTPLSSILSSLFLIEKYSDLIENNNEVEYLDHRKKHISRIKKSINHLTEILNDFLSLDKLDQGKISAKKEDFDLNIFSKEIIEEIKSILKKGQTIEYVFTGEFMIFQDKNILKNVFLNLLSNAIK